MLATVEGLSAIHEAVLSLLKKGRDGAKTSKQIIAELQAIGIDLGADPVRELRDIFHELRCAGYPICAVNSEPIGYYIAATPDELWEYISRELERIRKQAKAIAALRRYYRKWVQEVSGQKVIVAITEEGRQFLEDLLDDDWVEAIRFAPNLDRIAERFFMRASLAAGRKFDFNMKAALDWLKEQGINEWTIKEFVKEVASR